MALVGVGTGLFAAFYRSECFARDDYFIVSFRNEAKNSLASISP
jgi:hypothetical protein